MVWSPRRDLLHMVWGLGRVEKRSLNTSPRQLETPKTPVPRAILIRPVSRKVKDLVDSFSTEPSYIYSRIVTCHKEPKLTRWYYWGYSGIWSCLCRRQHPCCRYRDDFRGWFNCCSVVCWRSCRVGRGSSVIKGGYRVDRRNGDVRRDWKIWTTMECISLQDICR